jgi:hypothetical protein
MNHVISSTFDNNNNVSNVRGAVDVKLSSSHNYFYHAVLADIHCVFEPSKVFVKKVFWRISGKIFLAG